MAGPQAKAAALRAVELDAELAEAHGALAETVLETEWDWVTAERHYRRALALDPNNDRTLIAGHRGEQGDAVDLGHRGQSAKL